MHTAHPPAETHGLADDCPRCQQHAERPLHTLDLDHLARLLEGRCFTSTDRIAAATLRRQEREATDTLDYIANVRVWAARPRQEPAGG